MKKITLNLMTLLMLALMSFQSQAGSPWATEETPEASSQPRAEAEPITEAEDSAAYQESSRPASEEEAIDVEPATIPPTEAATTPAEVIQQGDVLNTPAQIAAVRILDFPRRGMTTDKVENELGRPVEIIPAVGQPPISRWVYDDRVVYFEYSSVIHVVAK